MIQKVSFRNFKAFRSLDLDLAPLTVLVGPNASGKTTLLQGILLATDLSGHRLDTTLPDAAARASWRTYGSTNPIECALSGVWGDISGMVQVTVELEAQHSKVAVLWSESDYLESVAENSRDEKFTIPGDKRGPQVGSAQDQRRVLMRDKIAKAIQHKAKVPAGVLSALQLSMGFRLDSHELAKASYSEKPVPEIGHGGEGLASVLAYLKLSQDEVFYEIEAALREIVPAVRRIRMERALVERISFKTVGVGDQRRQMPEKGEFWGNKVLFDMDGAKGVAADCAGDGVLTALGLLTALMTSSKPRLVLIDGLEFGLHPVSQGKLIDSLRRIQKTAPGLQIVATSNSPFILNCLAPEEVRLTFLAEGGAACCGRLSAHPEFNRWKDLMNSGELWSTFGEAWVEKVGVKVGARVGASESHE